MYFIQHVQAPAMPKKAILPWSLINNNAVSASAEDTHTLGLGSLKQPHPLGAPSPQMDDRRAPTTKLRVIQRERIYLGMLLQYRMHSLAQRACAFAMDDPDLKNPALAASGQVLQNQVFDIARPKCVQVQHAINGNLDRLIHGPKVRYSPATSKFIACKQSWSAANSIRVPMKSCSEISEHESIASQLPLFNMLYRHHYPTS
jgi:hypothetical protein